VQTCFFTKSLLNNVCCIFAYLAVVAQQRVCMPQYVKGFGLDGRGIFSSSPLDTNHLWSRRILVCEADQVPLPSAEVKNAWRYQPIQLLFVAHLRAVVHNRRVIIDDGVL
jgi:hypothetical protein